MRTGAVVSELVDADNRYFSAVFADLARKAVIDVGDRIEITVMNNKGEIASGPLQYGISKDEIRNAVVNVNLKLGEIIPEKSILLQNYPNPFNPETWIPFQLKDSSSVTIKIFNSAGQLIRNLDLGYKNTGIYISRSKAAYWDGKNEAGEYVASGTYFYTIQAGDYTATKKMVIAK